MERVCVTGASGFIGGHLVHYLKEKGYWVRGVDWIRPQFWSSEADEFDFADLRLSKNCFRAVADVDHVYQLAADMGGIGFISQNHAQCAFNNNMVNAHMLNAAYLSGVQRFFYSSSACAYPSYAQERPDIAPLKEVDAYPAQPEEGYGWEKLWAEKLCQYYTEDYGFATRVARFHNVYGPEGTYEGGREKAPAAICRKVARAPDGGTIDVWGDGQATRSFMHVRDCVEGVYRIMMSDYSLPLNLGRDDMISVDGLVDLVCQIAGKQLTKVHDLTKPQGVRGRNSDNSLFRELMGWEPGITLEEGLRETYDWILAANSRLTPLR